MKIGPLLQEGAPDWTRPYASTGGAASTEWRNASDREAVFNLLMLFRQLTVMDGLDPMVVHREFIKLDAYRVVDHLHTDEEGNFFYP